MLELVNLSFKVNDDGTKKEILNDVSLTLEDGKFLVIKDKSIVGVYDREDVALFESEQKYELGTFLIQKCTRGNEAYTQSFNSRVIFV